MVLDLYSRQIVGWAIGKRMKKQLILDALAIAYWRRKPPSQYGMVASMSRKGNCWDNAPTERFSFENLW
jgi:transposase InsO family protein